VCPNLHPRRLPATLIGRSAAIGLPSPHTRRRAAFATGNGTDRIIQVRRELTANVLDAGPVTIDPTDATNKRAHR
jgi:hypothetical protein